MNNLAAPAQAHTTIFSAVSTSQFAESSAIALSASDVLLAHLAHRLAAAELADAPAGAPAGPGFVAPALAEFADRRGLDPAGLACYLGTTPARLVRLALCRRPALAELERGLEMLTVFSDADRGRLGAVLREYAPAR